ncbi:hypothetical protein K7432_001327 [Basidiobolus ranarum]|uniref:Tyrosinase copper-binding domain-containing protein n=1 Tax=Basidiobolus ranarum TaxID=34480 RepID=A0ABR2W9T9_9FUNG
MIFSTRIKSIVLLLSAPLGALSQSCDSLAERREVRSLTPNELQAFINAVRDFHSGPSPTGYDRLANIHATYFGAAHNNAAFFPWHRKFLKDFEMALQKINPSVQLPYWDWSLDSQSPGESIIFSKDYFGGNGDANNGYCVTNGPFVNWTMRYPDIHCLRRQFDGSDGNLMDPFYSPETIKRILRRARNYDTLRKNIESPPHGVVHVGIGGSNGDMAFATSTNDPLFWLHHAFVDKIWSDWQSLDPSRYFEYGGTGPGNTPARLTDSMMPFRVSVNSMMDTSKPGLCYRYVEVTSKDSVNKRSEVKSLEKVINYSGHKENPTQHWYKLHLPKPLPEAYISMMGMSVPEVREIEKQWIDVTQSFNNNSTYISPICLAKKNETLSKYFHYSYRFRH